MTALTQWRTIQCTRCSGHGHVCHYSANDFEGEMECPDCNGSGRLFILPTSHVAQYPGGPFKGCWPGAYAKARPWQPEMG